jgi:hypothetical protein
MGGRPRWNDNDLTTGYDHDFSVSNIILSPDVRTSRTSPTWFVIQAPSVDPIS